MKKVILTLVSATVVFFGLVYLACFAKHKYYFTQAKELLTQGYPALAIEKIETIGLDVGKSKEECDTMLISYSNLQRWEKAEWAAQKCLFNKIETATIPTTLASILQNRGKAQIAARLLVANAKTFENDLGLHLKGYEVFKELKDNNTAAQFISKAAVIGKENLQVQVNALSALVEIGDWSKANDIAVRVKDTKIENVQVLLLMSTAMLKAKNLNDAQYVYSKAKSMAGTQKINFDEVIKNFKDLQVAFGTKPKVDK